MGSSRSRAEYAGLSSSCGMVTTARLPIRARVSRSPVRETTMRHRYIHRGALAAATLALASASATAADDFRGTFRGAWPDGQTTELTVVRIDDDGNAYGAYCHRSSRKARHFLFDLHTPTAGITASLDDEALRLRTWER